MKVNRLKKMLSVMLAAAMLVSSIPLGSSAGETDTAETTEVTEVAASKETEKDTDAENKEVSGETTPAPSENVQDLSSNGTEEQNTQPVEEPNSSNSAQEASVDNVQSAPQGGETASNPGNSTEEKKKENTPAKTSTFAPIGAPASTGETEVTLTWDIPEGSQLEWDNTVHEPKVTGCEGYTGDISELGLNLTYAKTEGGENSSEPGKYTATATVTGDKADEVTLTNGELNFEITKKKIADLTWTYPESSTYTGQPIVQPTAKFKNINNEDTDLTVTCVDSASSEVVIKDIKNAGIYTLMAALSSKDEQHYMIEGVATTKELEIKPCVVTLDWEDSTVAYDGKAHKIDDVIVTHSSECTEKETLKLEDGINIIYKKDGTEVNANDIKNVGTYTAIATMTDTNHIFAEGTETRTLTIDQLGGITVSPVVTKKIYDNNPTPLAGDINWGEQNPSQELKTELEKLLGEYPLTYAGEDAETYDVTFTAEVESKLVGSNFNVTPSGTFTITEREITIVPDSGQGKYYGTMDPTLTYTVSEIENDMIEGTNISKEMVCEAIDKTPLSREPGNLVNENGYKITFSGNPQNYNVKLDDVYFKIFPLPVIITPDAEQEKLFGQKEPDKYGYTAKIATDKMQDSLKTELEKTDAAVKQELGEYVLEREASENVGSHKFNIIKEDSALYQAHNLGGIFKNYSLEVEEGAPEFTILPIKITDVQKIDSRQDSLKVETNLDVPRQPGVTTGFKVEIVEYPKEANGINYSSNIDDYITNATSGVPFTGASDKLKINMVEYSKERKDNKKLVKWNGYLPAGTKIAVSVVDADGNVVSDGKTVVTVSPVNVSFDWSGFETSAVTGNYVTANKGAANPLSLTGSREGEWVEIVYNGKAADYGALNMQFTPTPQNANSKHVTQSVTANIVDTLNLVCESKSLQFYVDDSAFSIPASSIRFENRGEEITIQLPEQGTLTEVSILDGKVELSGNMGQEFTLPVSWSGKNLIPTGAPISITYTDQAGHQGSGIAAASRSTVSTPITFRIRPELNINGYLNGRSDMLIVSGTACSCEPIRITVAGSTQTTYATQKEVWSDSNGSWEAMFSMGALPEDQDFTISAEYVDVNGQGYSISAKFDAFCASPSVVSPIYEAMSYISGMVEPGTAVALVLNGDSQNYYEIQVDRFGHFVMDDVPMMFGGEDSFDIYVTDIAGNVSIRHYEVEEPGDPFEVTGKVNPLGKFLYSASENDSITLAATPVSADDFDEKKADVEIPLLMGMSYEVGTLTLHKTASGFTVSKEIKVDEEIAAEDYRFENEKLYVYTSRPSVDELKSASGQEAAYGAEIPLGEGETVWIVSESDMTILADDVAELKQFDFENSEEYAKYQEK